MTFLKTHSTAGASELIISLEGLITSWPDIKQVTVFGSIFLILITQLYKL